MKELAVRIVRFADEHQPGFVACEFKDASGRGHTIIEKVPVVSAEKLDAYSAYPTPGGIPCEVLDQWKDSRGREFALIANVESLEGLSEFVVFASQLREVQTTEKKRIVWRGVSMIEGWPEKIQAAQKLTSYTRNGDPILRVRYGDEKDLRGHAERPCHDCAVFKGEFHVPGCDMEQCPVCGEQAITCDCDLDDNGFSE